MAAIPWCRVRTEAVTWETYYPEWGEDVRCAVYLPGRSVALIDPLVPAGRSASLFWKTLDYLVLKKRLPLNVLLTVFWHERSAPSIAARYPQTRVWCPSGGRELSTSARRFYPELVCQQASAGARV